jgi:cytochrome c-type biogenesis protein CcmH/NrfG
MTGIQLLRKILAEEPENVSVLFVLGKFAMRTGQYDKAVERFEKIISIPKIDKTDLTESYFLLAESYKMLNQSAKAKEAYEKCLALADDPALKEGLQKAIKELK